MIAIYWGVDVSSLYMREAPTSQTGWHHPAIGWDLALASDELDDPSVEIATREPNLPGSRCEHSIATSVDGSSATTRGIA